jgi:hypothetical protein
MPTIESTELRYEVKLSCSADRLSQARSWIRLHPDGFRKTYPSRIVNNIYLDTPNVDSFRANLSGVSLRQKLRLRWYGEEQPTLSSPILELKYKSNLLGGKKRQVMNCTLDLQRPWDELMDILRSSATSYWKPWLSAASQPTLLNKYRREYYATFDGVIRATLDYSQIAFDQRHALRPNLHARLNLPNNIVIELKAGREEEQRLQMSANGFPISRDRNSKYVNGLMVTPL